MDSNKWTWEQENNCQCIEPCISDVSRKGGRRLGSIQYSVEVSIQWQEQYIKICRERQITATRNNTDETGINRTKLTRKQKWDVKQFYGHSKWHEKTESLLIAAKNNAISVQE